MAVASPLGHSQVTGLLGPASFIFIFYALPSSADLWCVCVWTCLWRVQKAMKPKRNGRGSYEYFLLASSSMCYIQVSCDTTEQTDMAACNRASPHSLLTACRAWLRLWRACSTRDAHGEANPSRMRTVVVWSGACASRP